MVPSKLLKRNCILRKDGTPIDPEEPFQDMKILVGTGVGGASLDSKVFLRRSARDFILKNCIENTACGIFNLGGFAPTIPLTGTTKPEFTKFITVNFALLMGNGEYEEGERPTYTSVTLRKGDSLQGNKSLLTMPYKAFATLVREGRKMLLQIRKNIVGTMFQSGRDVPMPEFVVLDVKDLPQDTFGKAYGKARWAADRAAAAAANSGTPTPGGKKKIILLTVTLMNDDKTPPPMAGVKPVFPCFNIREYEFLDNKCTPTGKGVSIGMQALFMLVHPVDHFITMLNDAISNIKFSLDNLEAAILNNTPDRTAEEEEDVMGEAALEFEMEEILGEAAKRKEGEGGKHQDSDEDEYYDCL